LNPLIRRRVDLALDYIHGNIEAELSLDVLASIASMSRYHFARTFKEVTGSSPHKYVSLKRLEHAMRLLCDEMRSAGDIATTLGYSSQANFARAFRKVTGLSPIEFRQRLR
jgi:AraC family transcriptional regulator